MYSFIVKLLHPLTILFLLWGLAIVWLWIKAHPRRGRMWPAVALYVMLWLYCTPVVAVLAAGMLEWHYPPPTEIPEDARAVVVLSGGAIPPSNFVPETRLADSTLRRCAYGIHLYHQHGPRLMIVCGGKPDPTLPGDPLAAMQRFLIDAGVAPSDILVESESTDTYENAVGAARLLNERDIDHVVLVTDATHMWRASRCFARQEIEVTPAAAYYKASFYRWSIFNFVPRSEPPQTNQEVFHELVGVLWYTLRGRI